MIMIMIMMPVGALHVFWVRGRPIGKSIDFSHIDIRNGTDFQDSGVR